MKNTTYQKWRSTNKKCCQNGATFIFSLRRRGSWIDQLMKTKCER